MIEKVIVYDIDEKLSRSRVRITRTSHGDGVLVVTKTVIGFIFDRFAGLFLLHPGLKAAALNHETGNNTVKDRVVVEAIADVLFEIFARCRSMFVIEFDINDAVVGS